VLYAYSFQSDQSLDEIFARFNQIGPWRWVRRDNDSWGEYISSGVLHDPHYGILKLIVEPDHYAINVMLKSEHPDARDLFDQVRGILFDKLLPAIGARDLIEVQDYD
jgi:hypothetical protein